MRTGREAEQRASELSKLSLVRVSHTTRILREASDDDRLYADLWVKSGRGKRDAWISPQHAMNLTLALMVQPSEGPAFVQMIRSLVNKSSLERVRKPNNNSSDSIGTYTETTQVNEAPFPTANLGFQLDCAAYAYAGWPRAGYEELFKYALELPKTFRLSVGHRVTAEKTFISPGGSVEFRDVYTSQPNPLSSYFDLNQPEIVDGLFDQIFSISPKHFQMIAEIVGKCPYPTLPVPEPSSDAASESETAAFIPCRG